MTHHWPYKLNETGNIPQLDKPVLLIYYMGYWLPAALVGKMFGWAAARFFLYLWTVLGITLTYYLLCRMFNRFSLRLLFIFLFFSGLYILGSFMKFSVRHVLLADYKLWADNMLLAGSVIGDVFWIYNQTVTLWVIAAVILNNIPKQNIFFMYALCFVHGPFFFIGFFPFIVIIVLKELVTNKSPFFENIKPYFSFQNTIGAVVTLLIEYFYLTGSPEAESVFIQHIHIVKYAAFVFLAFGAISLLIFSKYRKEPFYYAAVISLLVLPLIGMGTIAPFVFCARVSLAPMFILMMLVAKYVLEEGNTGMKKLVVAYLFIGAIEPALQVTRSVIFTVGYHMNHAKMNKYLYNRAQKETNPPPDFKTSNFLVQNGLRSYDSPDNPYNKFYKQQSDSTFFVKYLMKEK